MHLSGCRCKTLQVFHRISGSDLAVVVKSGRMLVPNRTNTPSDVCSGCSSPAEDLALLHSHVGGIPFDLDFRPLLAVSLTMCASSARLTSVSFASDLSSGIISDVRLAYQLEGQYTKRSEMISVLVICCTVLTQLAVKGQANVPKTACMEVLARRTQHESRVDPLMHLTVCRALIADAFRSVRTVLFNGGQPTTSAAGQLDGLSHAHVTYARALSFVSAEVGVTTQPSVCMQRYFCRMTF